MLFAEGGIISLLPYELPLDAVPMIPEFSLLIIMPVPPAAPAADVGILLPKESLLLNGK
jgi:hypothetical protein